MPRLLAADGEAAPEQFLHHIFVAHRAPYQLNSRLPESDLQPDVAHHGCDDGVALEAALALQLAAAHQEHCISIYDLAALVDENGAIAVAVERHADGALGLDDDFRQPLRMRRPATEIDVAPIG